MARIIGEVQPQYAFVENSPMLTVRGLGTVLGDLSEMGYDCRWGVISAADVGANHQRDRIWIVGKISNSTSIGSHKQKNKCILESQGGSELQSKQPRDTSKMAYSSMSGFTTRNKEAFRPKQSILEEQSRRSCNEFGASQHWWKIEPNVGRVVDGLADRVDRLKAIGNGQVPLCAATAWRILSDANNI
jgi:DNA (cytosine-5)-methyltransferase 1